MSSFCLCICTLAFLRVVVVLLSVCLPFVQYHNAISAAIAQLITYCSAYAYSHPCQSLMGVVLLTLVHQLSLLFVCRPFLDSLVS